MVGQNQHLIMPKFENIVDISEKNKKMMKYLFNGISTEL